MLNLNLSSNQKLFFVCSQVLVDAKVEIVAMPLLISAMIAFGHAMVLKIEVVESCDEVWIALEVTEILRLFLVVALASVLGSQ